MIIMDTKKLRQKILDLAIHGKLVPQDPNDEPASVLLERIRAEKERLIAEGKIKRPKKSKASSAESHYQQFEIPDSWEWATLGDVFSMQAGKSIQATELKEYNSQNPYPCFGGNGVRGYLSRYSHEGTYPIIGRQGALCGNINIAKGKFYATEHAVVVNYFANTNVMLWVLFLENLNLNQYATATAQPGLSVAKIEEVPIPIPPIQEQKRIVEAVQNWMECVGKLSVSSTQLSDSVKSAKSKILELAMQGKLVPQDPANEPAADMLLRINPKAKIITDNPHYPQLPDNWVLTRLGDVVKVINGKSQKEVENLSGSYPIYGSGGIIGMADTYSCLSGSTIIGRKGTISNPQFIETNFWNVDTAFGMKPNEAVDDLYFYYFCKSFDFKTLDKSSTLPSLTKSAIEAITLPIPPLNEQLRIISKIKEYDGLFSNIIKQIGQK